MILIMVVLALVVGSWRNLFIAAGVYGALIAALLGAMNPEAWPAALMSGATQGVIGGIGGAIVFTIKIAVWDRKRRRPQPRVAVDPGPRY